MATDDRDTASVGGRLAARPRPATANPGAPAAGLRPLGLGRAGHDALLLVPAAVRPDRPAPLVVAFHGAGGKGRHMLPVLADLAEEAAFILLAPDSRGRTWDVILGGYGPDVRLVDAALGRVFAEHAVDPARLAAAGFSDGASYALSLGLANGDLFTHVLAFSPGFAAPGLALGAPRFFVTHGVRDPVLPIARTSRVVVPRLRAAGREVEYREFADGHVVPPDLAREAVGWFLGGRHGLTRARAG